jgi:hypothetical protein
VACQCHPLKHATARRFIQYRIRRRLIQPWLVDGLHGKWRGASSFSNPQPQIDPHTTCQWKNSRLTRSHAGEERPLSAPSPIIIPPLIVIGLIMSNIE